MEQLAGFPEGERKLALERFQLLRPHLEENRSLRSVAAEADIPFRIAQPLKNELKPITRAAPAAQRRTRHQLLATYSSASSPGRSGQERHSCALPNKGKRHHRPEGATICPIIIKLAERRDELTPQVRSRQDNPTRFRDPAVRSHFHRRR